MNVLEVNDLSKVFKNGKKICIKHLELEEGVIYGLIGKNGAGKTTTIKMLTGILKPTSGTIKYFGEVYSFGKGCPKQTSYLPDVPQFYDYMNAREYLKLCAGLMNVKEAENKITQMLNLVGLKDTNVKIKSYSRGMKQRLGIASAMLNDPKIIFLDEPTSALDPVGRHEIINIINSLKNKTTVVFSTHILADVEKVCDKSILINDGVLVDSNSIKDMLSNENTLVVKLQNSDELKCLFTELQKLKDIQDNKDSKINIIDDEISIISNNYAYWIRFIQKIIVEKNLILQSLNLKSSTLEEIVLKEVNKYEC